MRIRMDPKLLGIFALAVALLLASMLLVVAKTRYLHVSTSWVLRSDSVLLELEKLLSSLKDAETGQRGYLLTGKTEYLEPYGSRHPSNQWAIGGVGRTHQGPASTAGEVPIEFRLPAGQRAALMPPWNAEQDAC